MIFPFIRLDESIDDGAASRRLVPIRSSLSGRGPEGRGCGARLAGTFVGRSRDADAPPAFRKDGANVFGLQGVAKVPGDTGRCSVFVAVESVELDPRVVIVAATVGTVQMLVARLTVADAALRMGPVHPVETRAGEGARRRHGYREQVEVYEQERYDPFPLHIVIPGGTL